MGSIIGDHYELFKCILNISKTNAIDQLTTIDDVLNSLYFICAFNRIKMFDYIMSQFKNSYVSKIHITLMEYACVFGRTYMVKCLLNKKIAMSRNNFIDVCASGNYELVLLSDKYKVTSKHEILSYIIKRIKCYDDEDYVKKYSTTDIKSGKEIFIEHYDSFKTKYDYASECEDIGIDEPDIPDFDDILYHIISEYDNADIIVDHMLFSTIKYFADMFGYSKTIKLLKSKNVI
jgi:hypothetical protein